MDHKLLILGLLKLQEMHGYQLGDLIDRRLNYLTDLKKPTLYHLLGNLESTGDVVKHASREGNRPERYTYQLTLKGKGYFQELLAQNLAEAAVPYFNDDIGLIFLSELPVDQARHYLELKRASVKERLGQFRAALVRHRPGTPPHLTIKHHLIHLRAERSWLDEILRDMAASPAPQDILKCLADEGPTTSRLANSNRRTVRAATAIRKRR